MAGFMSHGLGFNSTMGAFIGGAARQANELYAEDRAQQRQDDILQQAWAADADKAAQKYNDKKQGYADQISLRQSILQQTGGNEQATDSVLARLRLNPKASQDEINNMVKAYSSVPTPPNYKSPFMNNLQSQAQAGYEAAQSSVNRLNPKYQGRVQPITPWDGGQQPPQGNGNVALAQPQGAQPSAQQGYSPGALEPEQNNAQASGEPIPLDNLNKLSISPAQTPSAAPGMPNPTPGQNPDGSLNIPGKSATVTPYQAHQMKATDETKRLEQERIDILRASKPATPQEAADIAVQTDDAKKYLHSSIKDGGLQARYAELSNLASQRVDINEMYDALNRGLMASKPQDMFDQMNRLVQPLLGIDLNSMGVSNTIQDTNLMKKAISNAIINRLSQLHFGRITNKEATYVENGLGSTNTDPNTNMKITLALKDLVQSTIEGVNKEYQAVYSDPKRPLMERVQEGRAAQIAHNNSLANRELPWVKAHTAQEALAMPIGQWFEDSDGMMRIRTQLGDTRAAFKKAGDKL
jgi:hypothetical protein